jgi:hypothetical protein
MFVMLHVPNPALKSWNRILNDGCGAFAVNVEASPIHTVLAVAGDIVVAGSGLIVDSTVVIQPVGSI